MNAADVKDCLHATHIGLDTAVAVKFMSPALVHDGALIERFAREAKLASRIKSPHVVQIFDFATTHEGIPYIVMELIEGETLEARIRRDGKLGLDETSRILVQLCRALSKAHEVGIIHRDMQPDNILLGKEEGELFVRILDFGIAKHVNAPSGVTDAGARGTCQDDDPTRGARGCLRLGEQSLLGERRSLSTCSAELGSARAHPNSRPAHSCCRAPSLSYDHPTTSRAT